MDEVLGKGIFIITPPPKQQAISQIKRDGYKYINLWQPESYILDTLYNPPHVPHLPQTVTPPQLTLPTIRSLSYLFELLG